MSFGWAEVIALAALALSLLTIWLRYLDRGRASFVAGWSSSDQVKVVNIGPGAATSVSVSVASTLHSTGHADTATASFVPPQQAVTVSITRAAMVEHGPVEIRWHDGRRSEQRFEITLGPPPRSRPRVAPQRDALEVAVREVAKEVVEDYREHERRNAATFYSEPNLD